MSNPPNSPTPSAVFMDDSSLGIPSYNMSGLWDPKNQLSSDIDGLQTNLMMDGMTMPALNGYTGTSPSVHSFGDGSGYSSAASNGSMRTQEGLPGSHFTYTDPYHSDGATGQIFGWDF